MTNNAQQSLTRLKTALHRSIGKSSLDFVRRAQKPVIICDRSGSMQWVDPGQELSRQALLNNHLAELAKSLEDFIVIAFNDSAEITTLPISNATGGTDMAGAIYLVASLRPSQVIIISDGSPNSTYDALEARASLGTIRVDTIYVGDPLDTDAKDFMARLATNGGQALTDGSSLLANSLAEKMLLMLTDGDSDSSESIAL